MNIDQKLINEMTAVGETQRIMYMDLQEPAEMLRRNFGQYFKPYTEPIFYYDGVVDPVLDFTKADQLGYYTIEGNPLEHNPRKKDRRVIKPVRSLNDVTGDVYREDGLCVFRIANMHKLLSAPWYPLREMDLIQEFVADHAWGRIPIVGKSRPHEDIIADFLDPKLRRDWFDDLPTSDKIEWCDDIWLALQRTLNEVKQFMGPDKWVIHLVRRSYLDLVVEKTVDYRIYDWTRRMQSGEWK
jgi:hypothetical protein